MSRFLKLTDARVILLAAQLSSDANVAGLHELQRQYPDILKVETVCRILLTFLPEGTEPALYIPFLKYLIRGEPEDFPDVVVDTSSVAELSEPEARKRVQGLRLQQLVPLSSSENGQADFLTPFIIERAHQLDAATSDLQAVQALVEPFVEHSEVLRVWMVSTLLPLLRLEYEYHPNEGPSMSLRELESLSGESGVATLMQYAKQDVEKSQIGRDLRGIVAPWIYGSNERKRRKMDYPDVQTSLGGKHLEDGNKRASEWQDVHEWLLSTSLDDFSLAVKAISEWDGPKDMDLGGYEDKDETDSHELDSLRYGQAGLAAVYATEISSPKVLEQCWRVLGRVSQLTTVDSTLPPDRSKALPEIPAFPSDLTNTSRAAMLRNALLRPENEITKPSKSSLLLLHATLVSLETLASLGALISVRSATEICLFGSEALQKQEFRRILQSVSKTNSTATDWRAIREKVLWLQSWGHDGSEQVNESGNFLRRALLWRLAPIYVDTEILDALLNATQYQTAIDIYIQGSNSPLSSAEVESRVEAATLNSYDNASNGNRTRGGMKRVSEILKAFQPHFGRSARLQHLQHLLAATHSLSFYHLTLQHGVPFQPVNIRVHHDPLSLIEKVLEQNPKAYTKLDDLLSIGRNLVAACLPTGPSHSTLTDAVETTESKTLVSEHRITYAAITSALSSNDFETAYSYILTRLSPTQSGKKEGSSVVDDTSWRAAYAAGHYRPSIVPQSLAARIGNLSQRMELLSLSLTLAPTPEPLSEILGAWRRCEEELNSLRSQEADEERAWDERGDGIVPGGFSPEGRDKDRADTRREQAKRVAGRRTAGLEDEAPMGLFDVARGAARAIGKSAFPLSSMSRPIQVVHDHQDQPRTSTASPTNNNNRSSADTTRRSEDDDRAWARSGSSGSVGSNNYTSSGEQRVRKRDMVSNMVTGGLVSGMSWVLGAPPVNPNPNPNQNQTHHDDDSE